MSCEFDFASKARYRVEIEQLSLSADTYGGQASSWVNVTTCWAAVIPMSGREVFASQQLNSRVTHKFVIRYDANLSDTLEAGAYRLKLDSRIHSVQFVRNLDPTLKEYGHAFQEITTEENAAEVAAS